MQEPNYWIVVLAADQVERAREGGYAELNGGRVGFLERMRKGDGLVFYSPRSAAPKGELVQKFTAIGEIEDATLARVALTDGSAAFRVTARYRDSHATPIKPLLEELSFVRNRQHWGAAFRFGGLRVAAPDFERIATAMGARALQREALA